MRTWLARVGDVLSEPQAHVTTRTYLVLWGISAPLAAAGIGLYLFQPTDWTWYASGAMLVPAGWLLAEHMPDSERYLGANDTGPDGPP